MCGFCGFSFSVLRLSEITGRRKPGATSFNPAGVAPRQGTRCPFVDLCQRCGRH